jgi:hypothetical protein
VHGGFFSQAIDTDITQTNAATVAAYTTLADCSRVYDYSMYFKGLNITNMKWLGIANQIFTVSGTTLVATFANLVFDNAAASMFVQATNTLTLKNTAASAKFSAMSASSITVAASATVSGGLTGPVTNAGTISGDITGNVINSGTLSGAVVGNVTNTGTLASGASITGNVTQATPINLTGVTITGNLTFNTNTPITVVFDNTDVSGTVSNSGTGLVTLTFINGSSVGTVGSNVASFAQTTITDLDTEAYGTTWNLGWIDDTSWTAADKDDAPNTWTGWNEKSGTGNTTTIDVEPNTLYQLFLRIPGYYSPIGPVATIDTTIQSLVAIGLEPDRDVSDALLWPQTAAYAAQAANFSYNLSTDLVEYDNTTGATVYIAFLAAYRALELITKDSSVAYDFIQPVYLNGAKNGFFVPRTAPLYATMKSTSTGSAILQADLSYPDNQQPAYDRLIATTPYTYLLSIQPTATVSQFTIDTIREGLALTTSVMDSNIIKVNDVFIDGTGTQADPFGPL